VFIKVVGTSFTEMFAANDWNPFQSCKNMKRFSKNLYKDAFETVMTYYGQIDIVINNAGIGGEAKFEDIVNVNVIGVMRGTQLAFEFMDKSSKGGLVINVASLAGLTPTPMTPTYSATKHAVVAYTRNYGVHILKYPN
jgi:short-subunit dehydrogenase